MKIKHSNWKATVHNDLKTEKIELLITVQTHLCCKQKGSWLVLGLLHYDRIWFFNNFLRITGFRRGSSTFGEKFMKKVRWITSLSLVWNFLSKEHHFKHKKTQLYDICCKNFQICSHSMIANYLLFWKSDHLTQTGRPGLDPCLGSQFIAWVAVPTIVHATYLWQSMQTVTIQAGQLNIASLLYTISFSWLGWPSALFTWGLESDGKQYLNQLQFRMHHEGLGIFWYQVLNSSYRMANVFIQAIDCYSLFWTQNWLTKNRNWSLRYLVYKKIQVSSIL